MIATFLARFGLAWLVPGGGIWAGLVSLFWAIFDELSKSFRACLLNPRVFIIMGIVAFATYRYGVSAGFDQGKGDLDTYRQQAEVLNDMQDKNAQAATAARDKAKAEERAKIAAEARAAKAEADAEDIRAAAEAAEAAKARPAPVKQPVRRAPKPKPDWTTEITGSLR